MATLYYGSNEDGFEAIGYCEACSICDLTGPSYVHFFPDVRERFGIPMKPFDWFFDTYKQAAEFAKNMVKKIEEAS